MRLLIYSVRVLFNIIKVVKARERGVAILSILTQAFIVQKTDVSF